MQLDAFILADAVATPPDGKFYVQGGGLTRMEAPGLPAPISIAVLIQLGVDEDELKADHTIRLTLFGPTGQPNVAPIEIKTQLDPDAIPALRPGEPVSAVLSAPLTGLAVRAGVYRVELKVDEAIHADRTFVFLVPDGVAQVAEGVAQVADLATAASPAASAERRPAKQKRPPPPPRKKAKRR
jgi:hypothetical protein